MGIYFLLRRLRVPFIKNKKTITTILLDPSVSMSPTFIMYGIHSYNVEINKTKWIVISSGDHWGMYKES